MNNPALIQKAFIEEQAAQCGYCIAAGMMMRAQALLMKNPAADREANPRVARAQSLSLRNSHAHSASGGSHRTHDAADEVRYT